MYGVPLEKINHVKAAFHVCLYSQGGPRHRINHHLCGRRALVSDQYAVQKTGILYISVTEAMVWT